MNIGIPKKSYGQYYNISSSKIHMIWREHSLKLAIKLCLDVLKTLMLSPLAIFSANKIQSNIIPLYDVRIWDRKFELEAKLRFDNKRKRKLEREVVGHMDLNFFHYNLDVSYIMHY